MKNQLSWITIAIALMSGIGAVRGFETAQGVTATPIDHVPFTINTPGNYFLPTDLESALPGAAITVDASQVVIDLNGRTLKATGAARTANVGIGIVVLNQEDVTVQNGDIDKFGAYGVLFAASDGKKEHNFKNLARNINFNSDLVGILIVSGSLDLVEHCNFEGGSIGIYDVASLGGDRFQADNFEAQTGVEALNEGVGIVSSGGVGNLTEDCMFADAQTLGLAMGNSKDLSRFNSFINCAVNRMGGTDLGAASN